jgi:hypothetical protein
LSPGPVYRVEAKDFDLRDVTGKFATASTAAAGYVWHVCIIEISVACEETKSDPWTRPSLVAGIEPRTQLHC